MPFQNDILAGASGSGESAYTIDYSIRIAALTATPSYLAITPASSGDLKTWTFSIWTKRGEIDGETSMPDGREDFEALFNCRNSSKWSTFGFEHGSRQSTAHGRPIWQDKTYVGGRGSSTTTQSHLKSGASCRDPAAWYHFVVRYDTTQVTSTDRIRLYKNGDLLTDDTIDCGGGGCATYPAQDYDGNINFGDGAALTHIGKSITGQGEVSLYDGYVAEVFFLDGQSLDASSFGETSETTGQWMPKDCKDDLTFGTNGFYLNFSDSADLGNDSSGQGNDFTVTNLLATDQMLDTPTNNFSTWNEFTRPVMPDSASSVERVALGEVNLQGSWTSNDNIGVKGTMAFPSTGTWYYEMLVTGGTPAGGGAGAIDVLVAADGDATRTGTYIYGENGTIYANGTTYASAGATFTTSDITSALIDSDNSKIYFYKNGVLQGAAGGYTIGAGQELNPWSVWYNVITIVNFGQDSSFAGNKTAGGNADANGIGDFYYAPPTGALALCTANLPTPSILSPDNNFNTALYTGTGIDGLSISGVGFQPDFTWIKTRSTTGQHVLADILRSSGSYPKTLNSNSTAAEDPASDGEMVKSFDVDGFTLGDSAAGQGDVNYGTGTYASWNWKAGGTGVSNGDGSITSSVSANPTAGFSIVSYTGTGADATVGHGLSSALELLIVKSRDDAYNWAVWHEGLTSADYALQLNTTIAQANTWDYWNDTAPSASVFSLGTDTGSNNSTSDFIAYCFHSVEGYSKLGSYVGNAEPYAGTFTFTGFLPAFIMIKRISDVEDWVIMDNKRNTYNWVGNRLYPDLNNAEGSSATLDFLSNGFMMRSSNSITNAASTYIYLAIAESPFKISNAR